MSAQFSLADGSTAIVQANGTVITGRGGLCEFTDGDGTVYRDTPADREYEQERHRAAIRRFKKTRQYRHAIRRLRPATATRTRPCARPRGAGRPRATATRSSARSGDSGDDGPGEPPPPLALHLWRHPRYGSCSPNLLRVLKAVQR